jgi:hypothetical protein
MLFDHVYECKIRKTFTNCSTCVSGTLPKARLVGTSDIEKYRSLIADMTEIMCEIDAVGIVAPQVYELHSTSSHRIAPNRSLSRGGRA